MKKLIILFICGLFGFAVNAQTKKHILKGQVTDINGQPIKKVLVSDIITADSARTVEVGMFSLYSSNEIRSVEVSKIGYEDTRMCANGSTCITVMMRVKQEVVESELPAEGGCVIPIQ